MGGSMIKNTGASIASAASAGGELVKRLAPKAMDGLEAGMAMAQSAGKALKHAAPKALQAIEAGTKLAVVQKGGAMALKGGKVAAKVVRKNPLLTAAVVVASAGAAVLIARSKRKAAEQARGRAGKQLTPTDRRGSTATKATAKKASAKKAPARKAAPRKRATDGATSTSRH
jgi:DNA-binding protein HU-beta